MKPVLVPIIQEMRSSMSNIDWRGSGVQSETLIVCPIKSLAFLVIGLNPRRVFKGQYEEFIDMITERITMPQLSAVILREELERRGLLARQEAVSRAKLMHDLSESEEKLAKYSTRAPGAYSHHDLRIILVLEVLRNPEHLFDTTDSRCV